MPKVPDSPFPTNVAAHGQPVDELALTEIKSAILTKLRLAIGKDAGMATRHDWYKATALALRDRIVHHWLTTEKQSYDAGAKRNIASFYQYILGGSYDNQTAQRSMDCTLTCLLGREAARRGALVTMDELLKENKRLEPDLKGLKA